MALAEGVYAGLVDLRKGDIPLPLWMGDGSSYINAAAEEIDSQIGHLYITPIEIDPTPENRPSRLMLKRINALIASGRLILDLAAASENNNQHAYGMGMLKEGMSLLQQIVDGQISLVDAPLITDGMDTEASFTGPAIFNEDDVSLVQGFYDRHNEYVTPRFPMNPVPAQQPYGNKHEVSQP